IDMTTTEAETEEKDAQADYEALMADAGTKRAADSKALTEKSMAKAHGEESLQSEEENKKDLTVQLMETTQVISNLHAECDWLIKYFDVRKAARTEEIESLDKAKAVLNGVQPRHDEEGIDIIDIEASSAHAWRDWRQSLCPQSRSLLSVWQGGAARAPARHGRGKCAKACPWCPELLCSARHLWAACPRFAEARARLGAEVGIPADWWAARPRITAKSGWITARGGPSDGRRARLQIAAYRLGLEVLRATPPPPTQAYCAGGPGGGGPGGDPDGGPGGNSPRAPGNDGGIAKTRYEKRALFSRTRFVHAQGGLALALGPAAGLRCPRYPDALRDLDECIKLDPTFVKAYSRKGAAHFFMKEYNQAIKAYEQGLKIDKDNAECLQGREQVINKIGESQKGEVDEEQIRHAMADPEIQQILHDPQISMFLKQMQENPKQAQQAMMQ
ncbi:unnamed protein product, partial [Prorocentrum cordatum]